MVVLNVYLQYQHDAKRDKAFATALMATVRSDLNALGPFPHPSANNTKFNAHNARVEFKWENPSDVRELFRTSGAS